MKSDLNRILNTTVQNCFSKGELKKNALPDYVLEVPNNPDHGHFATNLPMMFAASQKRRPVEIAEIIVNNLEDNEGLIEKVEQFVKSQLGEDVVEFKKPSHTLADVVGFSKLKEFIRKELIPRFTAKGKKSLAGAGGRRSPVGVKR